MGSARTIDSRALSSTSSLTLSLEGPRQAARSHHRWVTQADFSRRYFDFLAKRRRCLMIMSIRSTSSLIFPICWKPPLCYLAQSLAWRDRCVVEWRPAAGSVHAPVLPRGCPVSHLPSLDEFVLSFLQRLVARSRPVTASSNVLTAFASAINSLPFPDMSGRLAVDLPKCLALRGSIVGAGG